ncbi:6,7-dimethyl-8-ribityllumazine synthase [Patescibacteria group bacterium]|nr:MAG: 6,7-dimethyl-8-ribityllumazine synthase [Patescibacteria group bacterium]
MQRKHYAKKRPTHNGSKLSFGIAVSRFNTDITSSLLESALKTLSESGVHKKNITILEVPGSFELPYACLMLSQKKPDAIIALGCIIKGETSHDQYIAHATATGLTEVSLKVGIPIIFGVLTTNNLKQAKVRSTGIMNKGKEAAETAIEMASLNKT